MEMRTRRGKEGSSMGVDERMELRKQRRANDGEDESEAEHCVTQLMRGVVEGELMQSSSGSEYEPKIEEEGDSGGEISLEAESDVDGEMWETMGTDDDVGLEHNMAECSNEECKVGGRPMEGRGHRRWKGELS